MTPGSTKRLYSNEWSASCSNNLTDLVHQSGSASDLPSSSGVSRVLDGSLFWFVFFFCLFFGNICICKSCFRSK